MAGFFRPLLRVGGLEPFLVAAGLASVAVGTPHLALVDLGLDGSPSAVGSEEVSDGLDLLSAEVIEVEDDRIGLSTVHARVGLQVFQEALPVAENGFSLAIQDVTLGARMLSIVLLGSVVCARAAVATEAVTGRVLGGEFCGVLGGLAGPASLGHAGLLTPAGIEPVPTSIPEPSV